MRCIDEDAKPRRKVRGRELVQGLGLDILTLSSREYMRFQGNFRESIWKT